MSRYRRRSGRLTPDPLRRFLLQLAQRKWQAVGMSELSPFLASQLDALRVVERGAPIVEVEMPLRIESRANIMTSNHWAGRAAKVKQHRSVTKGVLVSVGFHLRQAMAAGARYVVLMTRIAPRKLDGDNLASAFKAVRDGVADTFAVDDGDERVRYVVDQRTGKPKEYAARIAIYAVTP